MFSNNAKLRWNEIVKHVCLIKVLWPKMSYQVATETILIGQMKRKRSKVKQNMILIVVHVMSTFIQCSCRCIANGAE